MNQIRISDITMRQTGAGFSLSFREKIELAKLLDNLGVSAIELEPLGGSRTDDLRIKSIAAAVKNSVVAAPVGPEPGEVARTWEALKGARHPRLQVCAPVSSVQMEYLHRKKPEAMLEAIRETVALCRGCCADVEFVADDATRAEPAFLDSAVTAALEAGASTVTVCDAAGNMLPEEFGAFVEALRRRLPALEGVTLGISCRNDLSLADACAVAAVGRGAGELKAAAYPVNVCSLEALTRILNARGGELEAVCPIRGAQLSRSIRQIAWTCRTDRSKTSPFDSGVREEDGELFLTVHDGMEAVLQAVAQLGYELSREDAQSVWEAFRTIAAKRDRVSVRELDAIVASAAMQVPQAYTLETYVINAGNAISSSAHLRLRRHGELLEGVCLGDGPIDAAFLAIEQITGRHYELDDFQIQAVTQGREAMGQTIVRLRSGGKLYSGRGISTDIVGSGIGAYLSALNKIVYEEEEA